MRAVLGAVVIAVVLALPASAASTDPRVFVLSQADVPKGYMFDESNSLLVPRALIDRASDEGSRRLRRSGFQAGYFARYLNSNPPYWRYVNTVAYVFREPKGARTFLPWMIRTGFAQAGGARRVDLGDEAWMYTSNSRKTGTSVVWRYGRVLAWVSCLEMTGHRTLALAQARKQQRRMAAALR